MFATRVCRSTAALFMVCTFGSATAGGVEPEGPRARVAADDPTAEAVPVTPWDGASPQRLVRIDDVLYQEDAGFYYRVVDDRITVGLGQDVRSWAELVTRATTSAPAAFGVLEQLTPERQNHLGIVDLALPQGEDPTEWCELVFQTGLVRYAEVSTYGVYTVAPNDPQYSQQWALNNTGQTGGTPGADIDAELAWTVTSGSPATIVGVLDSGTWIDHEDLVLNVWHNDGEIPDNGVDDDANGYIDDWEGWDFGNNNNDPRSSNFHGTHVMGIINAATDNGLGVAGLAGGFGGPGVQGMALGVGESAPNGAVLDDALIYAADNGARVITMSLTVGETSAINDALDYAYNTSDVFIDCAAGNNGPSVGYPARRAEVVAVASTDDDDLRSSFSNQGPEVEIAAPGSNIRSTQLNDSYGTSSGTSFAAPYVGALAALVRDLNPALPAPDVRQLLIDSAEDVEAPGFDNETGWGRINAFQAVSLTATADGTVRLDGDLYSCSDVISVTVADIDLGGSGSIVVSIRSNVESAGEPMTLDETGSGSGVFRGSIPTSAAAVAPDGLLQVGNADTITAEYVDVDDGNGGTNIAKTDSAGSDCLAPSVFDVAVTGADDTSATVVWTTTEPGTSLVRYGETVPPSQQAASGGLATGHAVVLSGLEPCTIYRYEVESADALGNSAVENNGGIYFGFETLGNFPGVGVAPCHQGQADLELNVYGCNDSVQVSVTDADLDTDSAVAETIQVLMTSTSEPGGEWIELTEAGVESTRFEGSIDLDPTGPIPADGLLGSAAGDLITVTYYDADDGEGLPRISTATAVADCTGPVIRDIQVNPITATQASISWTTDEPATSRVEFGPDASLGSVVESPDLVSSHSVVISAFESCDRVHFDISGVDARGDAGVADAGGQPFQFNLSQIGGLVFHDNFETDEGWNLGGEWDRGLPQGLGAGAADPIAAYSGSSVIGNDLSGEGAFPGDYEPSVKDWAFSPTMSTVGLTNLELIFRRKLGVTSSDQAAVAVFNPAVLPVWTNSGAVSDSDWVEARYDISGLADDRTLIRIGFRIESEDAGQSFGWNVDEVIIKDATQPDYLSCGGCAGAPTFGGLAAVYDDAPCGASGLTLEWHPAPAWGTGSSGTYDVHRATASDFEPSEANRIASGLTGTSWTDLTAPEDIEVWYAVRARSNESCTGGEGLPDDNLVRLSSTETITRPLPASPGDAVRADRIGGAHVRVSWDVVPGADHYVVRRSQSPDFSAPIEIGSTTETFLEDAGVANDGNFYSYRVFAVNACGQEVE